MLRHGSEVCYLAGYKHGSIECLNMAVRCCVCTGDMNLASQIFMTLSRVYFQYKQYDFAIQVYETLKDIYKDMQDNVAVARIFEMIAKCYLSTDKNQLALTSFQFMLQYAWLS